MLKQSCWAFILGSLTLGGCAFDPIEESNSVPVIFSINAEQIIDTKSTEEYPACTNSYPSQPTLQLTLQGENGTLVLENMPLVVNSLSLKTEPIFLPSGSYTLTAARVTNETTTLYRGVSLDEALHPFIPVGHRMGEQSFTLNSYTKPTLPLYLLCIHSVATSEQ